MKKYVSGLVFGLSLLLTGCSENKVESSLTFATSAEYPPFEYYHQRKIEGFDIELAQMIAKTLGKKAEFESMQFSSILAALQSGRVDAAISTITITEERQKKFDFSNPYYTESIAMVFSENTPITNISQLPGKKIACQLGTTMEIWLKEHAKNTAIVTMDNNNQAIEALKAGYVEGVFIDSIQANHFSRNNPGLSCAVMATSDTGYVLAFRKGSELKKQVNAALEKLVVSGELKKLQQKWFEEQSCKN